MLLLTNTFPYDITDVLGVFTTVEKAKKYFEVVKNTEGLTWSEPSNIDGSIYAYLDGGHVRIEPVATDPTPESEN